MPLAYARHERLSKTTALAVFSSDALSSVAYATEEILLILVLAGTAAAHVAVPVSVVIASLLLVVAISYQQTIHAYPSGGGSYIVARANLGTMPGLVAAAALMIDYVLTVSVSVAAGIAAVTSAIPALHSHKVGLGVICIVLIAFLNGRGIREAGRIFAVPTYVFIVTFAFLVGGGLFQFLRGTLQPFASHATQATTTLTMFLILRAFASGCTAMTGTEAISNGVPAFEPPESRNAAITLGWMAAILGTLFLGITFLASALHIVPVEEETVVSQIARGLFGTGLFYYLVQASTAAILVLAANTSYADFPRLASLLGRDGYAPRQFAHIGDRLVFSNGIHVLTVLAILLIVVFRCDTDALIPLYAVGVFISFTLSQAGMVHHWWVDKGSGWRWRLVINGTGALLTGIVTLVIAATKFTHGAWIIVVVIPLLVIWFMKVHHHYEDLAPQLSVDDWEGPSPLRHTVLVLVGELNRDVVRALQYVRSLAKETTSLRAVYVELDPTQTQGLEEKWVKWGQGVPLVVLDSPYRSLLQPLLEYLDQLQAPEDNHVVTVVLPEFIPARWWQQLLHNQRALLIKGALLFRENTVVADVPFHLVR
jgi:amino acid transporter